MMSALSATVPMPVAAAASVYWGSSFGAIMRALADALGAGERISVVTGECGVGKTTLLGVFRERIPPHWSVIHLDSCRTDADGLLPWVLHALGTPGTGRMAPDAALHEAAVRVRTGGTATALLIDEAQTLKGTALAQLVALLKRTSDDGLRLFLFGQPGLAVSLRRDEGKALAALPHRRHVLRPLGRTDVEGFIRFRSSACGRSGTIFTDEAVDLVCVASRGSPRLIDRLCDAAFEICRRRKARAVDADVVREAVRLANDFAVFAPDEAPLAPAATRAAPPPRGPAPAAPRPSPPARLVGSPQGAPPTAPPARRPVRSRAETGRPPVRDAQESPQAPRRPRAEQPRPRLRFLKETPPGSAVSSAELIVYESPDSTSHCSDPPLGPSQSPSLSAVTRRNPLFPDANALIKRRLLGLSAICAFVAAAGLLHPVLPSPDAGPLAWIAGAESTEEAVVASQAQPLPSSWGHAGPRDLLDDLRADLRRWRQSSEAEDDEAAPRLFGPSNQKRPLELGEVLELWRPYDGPYDDRER